MKVVLCVLALVCPLSASGQTVFFDDFEGNALLPHWSQPPPSHWEHTVSNSMLNVTGLLYPGIPHFSTNYVIIGARYAPQTDFRADVWMGWDQFTPPHRLAFHVIGSQGQGIATIGYRWDGAFGPNPVIFAGGGGQAVGIPPPPPGIYHFTITRVAAEFNFYFEGDLFATFPDIFGTPAAIVSLMFLGSSDPNATFGALHMDRIWIVPAPGSILVSTVLLAGCARRKRHPQPARLF